MIHFISFADKKLRGTLDRIKSEALNSNFFDKVVILDEDDLDEEMKNYCMENPRGFGFWSWKPVIVSNYLKKLDFGEILIYSDAGSVVNPKGANRFKEYIDFLSEGDNDAVFFQMGYSEKIWTKMDLIEHLNGHHLLDTGQVMGGCFFLKKTNRVVSLIEQWKDICQNHRNLIDDSPSNLKNDDSFMENRHDQSALSILVKKTYSKLFEDDCWKFVSHHDDSYPINAARIKF